MKFIINGSGTMNFFDLVNKRESVRGYLDKEVEKEKIIKIIEAARVAQSACNAQPWKFVVVNDKNLVRKIAENLYDPMIGINKFAITSPAFIVVVGEKRNLTSKMHLVISLGYYDEKVARRKIRKNIDEIYSFNKYK